MSFSQAKRRAIEALREGHVHHEPRAVQEQKNLLAVGAIGVDEAIALLQETKGNQARSSPFHADPSIVVWVFRPRDWYIKFYFIDDCFFVSFHKTKSPTQ